MSTPNAPSHTPFDRFELDSYEDRKGRTTYNVMTPCDLDEPGAMCATVVGDKATLEHYARLIATAPRLLGALEAIAETDAPTILDALEKAQAIALAAIAQAKGG